MISITEARRLILDNCPAPKAVELPLLQASGRVLAETVFSPIDTPPFDQSAMDGYAFCFEKWDGKSPLAVAGEVQAGNYFSGKLQPNEAVRIFTGAPIPSGADTVVMQEKVARENGAITINDEQLEQAKNVRPKSSQTRKGDVAIEKGELLTPAGISFLASIGIAEVAVFENPAVNIIVTGNELAKAGSAISGGAIYESNSIGLTAALGQMGIMPAAAEVVDDNEEELKTAIEQGLEADILILTGGVSVGDYDLVPAALEKCDVEQIFHKVKQKPGKPFWFGLRGNTLVFALPGNPAAVLTCFYEYIVPAIKKFTKKGAAKKEQLPLANDFTKKPGLTYFLKGKTVADGVEILPNQESYLLNSFAVADCIIELDESQEKFTKGDMVKVTKISP